jgi:mRNA interferase RelE/StbE
MKIVTYTADSVRDLKRHGNVAGRIRKAMADYALYGIAHANNVTALVGSVEKRMRIGDFRAIFIETDDSITVVKIGPRGSVYD